MTLDEDQCWEAVLRRDAGRDGRFVTGVLSTGVYCRPSCPARRPKRENVRFFASPAEAEAAGLRACLRCRPLATVGADPSTAAMLSLARHIEAHAEERLTLAGLAAMAGLSPFHVQRAFTAVMGASPRAYQEAIRLKRFKRRLKTEDSVAGAIFEAGFGSTSRVYESLDRTLGMTPSAYRAGAPGEAIAYAIRPTRLGLVLMAATDRGVCFVGIGEGEPGLLADLHTEFPRATLAAAGSSAALEDWMAALEAHLTRRGPRPDLPLDLRGTAFQLAVWRFLTGVKEGETVSYTQVAVGVGASAAVRAAANACARNRIAVLVPCHRVLRADGGLGGYRWGEERKRSLLAAEQG